MNKMLVFLGIAMVFSGLISTLFIEEYTLGEQLCVDGNNNKNLAGIMCEKTENRMFNLNPLVSLFFLLTLVLGGVFICLAGSFAEGRVSE